MIRFGHAYAGPADQRVFGPNGLVFDLGRRPQLKLLGAHSEQVKCIAGKYSYRAANNRKAVI